MGCSKKTGLKIHNNTALEIHLGISEIDDYDWDGVSRPDNNINGKTLKRYADLLEREEINAMASCCMYRLTMTFSDGRVVSQRFDQKKALDSGYTHTQVYVVEGERISIVTSTTSVGDYSECLLIFIDNKPLKTTELNFCADCYDIAGGFLQHTYVYTMPKGSYNDDDRYNFQCYGGVERNHHSLAVLGDLELAIALCCHNPYDLRSDYNVKRTLFLSKFGDSSGILYGVTGVCHQMANRILYACKDHPEVFDFTPSAKLSYVAYGVYGNALFTNESNWTTYLAECELLVREGRGQVSVDMNAIPVAVLRQEALLHDKLIAYTANGMSFKQKALALEVEYLKDEELPNKRLELLINLAYPQGFNKDKENMLLALNREFHKERKNLLQGDFRFTPFNNLNDLRAFAEKINPQHDKMLAEFNNVLTNEEFTRIFGMGYSDKYHLINMDNLK